MGLRYNSYGPPPGEPAPRAAAPEGTVVYAIGDIHGRADLLARLLAGIRADSRHRRAQRRVAVFLGDYVNRGPACRAVVDLLLSPGLEGFEVVTLMGNVEQAMLRYLDGEMAIAINWLEYGGIETAAAYGVTCPRPRRHDEHSLEAMRWHDGYQDAYGATLPPQQDEIAGLDALRHELAAALPPEHLAFFRGLRTMWREGGYCFVHAGIVPGVPLEEQAARDCMWIRRRFLDSGLDHGAVIVHGHSISAQPEVRRNRIGIDTGAYKTGTLTCLVLEGEERSFLQTG
jgi:serine/threonine protein phosphatase 1